MPLTRVSSDWSNGSLVFTEALAGTTARKRMEIDMVDSSTIATGINSAFYVSYTSSGAKTSTGEIDALAVDLFLNAAVAGYAYALSLYIATSGNPNINYMAGITSYIDAVGSGTVSTVYGIDNQMDMTNAPSQSAFMRCRAQGGTPDIVILLAGSPCATYLLRGDNQYPFVKAAVGGSNTAKLQCYFDGALYTIPLYTS